jgi:hypothetical protein
MAAGTCSHLRKLATSAKSARTSFVHMRAAAAADDGFMKTGRAGADSFKERDAAVGLRAG